MQAKKNPTPCLVRQAVGFMRHGRHELEREMRTDFDAELSLCLDAVLIAEEATQAALAAVDG